MSDRNQYDYYDFDIFDDSIDSRDYRRRQPSRRQTNGYNGRPSYDRRGTNRRPVQRRRRRRNRRRTRNRIIIVTAGILILALLISLIGVMINGCGKKNKPAEVSTETKPATSAATAPPATAATQNNFANINKLSTTDFVTAQPTDDGTTGMTSGAIYVWNNSGYELFGGSESMGQAYAETVNALAAKLPGISVYSMMAPNHTEMGLPSRLKTDVPTNSQADNMRAAYAAMDKTKITPINPYNYLSEHCNEYIYFKSDHHWTGLGAYYAYTAFADTLGLPALSLKKCTEQTIPGFTGTFTDLAPGMLDTDTVHYWQFPYQVQMDITAEGGVKQSYDSPYYEAEGSGSLSYGVFIYGDNPLTVMRSSSPDVQRGKKIAVIKESYGNAFVPYLTNNYEEVHVMDMRTFRDVSSDNFATYCQNNGITDVLFLNGIMSANNQSLLDSMTALFN